MKRETSTAKKASQSHAASLRRNGTGFSGARSSYGYENFKWDSQKNNFQAKVGPWFNGFTSEWYDGEHIGFGVRGKDGSVLWFHVVDEIRSLAGSVDYWVLAPSSTDPRVVGLRGFIYS